MFVLNLVTPEKRLVTDSEVEEVIVPGYRGQLDILPGHAPLMTTLSTGSLQYRLKGTDKFQTVVVSWGYCEVNPNGVTVLAETAESTAEIDKQRAEEALKKAQARLMEPILEPDQIEVLQRKLARAQARLDA
ncbi:MAG: ATP synthase F1 subunit epsilon [Bdellovibrionales bacterium]